MVGGIEFLGRQRCEVVRQEACCGPGRCGGKLRQHPAQVSVRVHAEQLASSNDTINDRRPPAGVRVPDVQLVAQADLRGPEASLDAVLIYKDVSVAGPGIGREVRPAPARVGHRLPEVADHIRPALKGSEALLQAFQHGFSLGVPETTPPLVRELIGTPLDPVELGDVHQKRQRLELIGAHRSEHVAAKVRDALKALYTRPVFEYTGIHLSAVGLHVTLPGARKEVVEDRAAAGWRELQNEGFFAGGRFGDASGEPELAGIARSGCRGKS